MGSGKAYVPAEDGAGWWRDIPGYNGKYRVNRNGDIQRVFQNGLVRDMTPYKASSKNAGNGLYVKLTADGKPKAVAVLKIMVQTWYGGKGGNLVAYHRNGIVTDNHVSNIGFTTREELGRLTGHMARRRTVFKVARDGEEVEVYPSAREAARANNMSYEAVLDRCHNKVKNPFALDGYTYRFEK